MSVETAKSQFEGASDDPFWRARASLAAPGVSRLGGRGLFALAAVAEGTVIEKACTVEILEEQARPLDAVQPIGDFYFAHPENPKAGLMAYGLMSFCNHADDANADMRWSRHDRLGWIAELVAVKPIREGEEITYRYKCPLWFSDNR